MGTSLAPVIGYEKAAKLAKEAHTRGLTIRELATEQAFVDPETLDRVLDPRSMTEPQAAESGKPSRKRTGAARSTRASSGTSSRKSSGKAPKKSAAKSTGRRKSAKGGR